MLIHLDPVLDTLRWLKHESNVWFEITTLLIPQANDLPQEIDQMCDWILKNLGDNVPLHFTAFHPDFRVKDRGPTPPETLKRARQQALKAGIKFVYTGNIVDVKGGSTYCPKCKFCLIERDWHNILKYNLKGNKCANCSEIIPGIFPADSTPGDWGRRRMAVQLNNAGG
jgi:pyruvate formate lyase activating enzyme